MSKSSITTVEYLDADTGEWFPVGWGMPPGTFGWMLEGRAAGTYRVIQEAF
ncbi:hypothetical protein [Microbacterium sp. Leaf203]|uniref:hypothetical protein n=1 Tax=Microbacterium sp. Leaf203 TaxID=1735677 RepID=UPI000B164F67|nr:hypothetical protein [Microbacterium sp. Leaf203]